LSGGSNKRSWRRAAIAGLVLAVLGASGASAASGRGHLPGFSVADRKVAIKDLPETLRFSFGGVPGVKGAGFPHHGHGPVWFGEVQRPKGTVYVGGNHRWVCVGEARSDELDGGSSCTTPAAAREFGILDISSCGKGPPRHFRVIGLVPDGITTMRVVKLGGAAGRTVPVIENAFAFTIGREDIVLHGSGSAATEALERTLPLAQAAKDLGGADRAGCAGYFFAEAKTPN